jgi:hypothetical protein
VANTYVAADIALERLRREIMLPRYVTRLGLSDFRGKLNDTVTMRVPAIVQAREYEWRTRNNPIELDELTEQTISVVLDKHIYSAIALTDEELTLDIVSFANQVLEPQVIAVAEKIEAMIATEMEGATFAADDVVYNEDANSEGTPFYMALVEARRVLNAAHVPAANRVVLIGSDVEASALKEEDLRRANTSGGTQTLRQGELGQLAGFTIITSQSISPDFAIAFHRSAFVFANVAPVVPEGVVTGRTVSEGGIAIRAIRDYDPSYLRDRSVLSSFAGTGSVNDARDEHGDVVDENVRAVKIDFTAVGS